MTTTYEILAPMRAVMAHLERHDLAAPVGINIATYGRSVTIHLQATGLGDVCAALLCWARSLADVTVEAWRPPTGDSVHLNVAGRLPTGLLVHVYAGVPFDAATFPDLPTGARHDLSVTVLHVWASSGEVAA
ncbi:hypothetical protein [Amycolatopsis sp.]|jgi:hypothetical protein|uniref:hypothetical protein n=1 Tax=Amycolatopsis sp. TaxID=37632 RepID=UPI002DF7A5B8|nr:hypothetical protein [Amycolatopsis sp.]